MEYCLLALGLGAGLSVYLNRLKVRQLISYMNRKEPNIQFSGRTVNHLTVKGTLDGDKMQEFYVPYIKVPNLYSISCSGYRRDEIISIPIGVVSNNVFGTTISPKLCEVDFIEANVVIDDIIHLCRLEGDETLEQCLRALIKKHT